VLAMLAHYPDRFAAGIDIYGPTDLKTFLANTAPYRRPNRIAEYGDPVRDSEYLDNISPARHADKIKAPLLVVQGANDPIVPPSESVQIVEKIKADGGEVEYMLLTNEGHGLKNLENRIKVFEAIVSFLDKYMQKKSPENSDSK
jgi:dipeptidyl aminopeptidase/acylaminoacyl peptidase